MAEPTVVSEPVVPARARLEPGRRLGNRYVIRAVVGAGGMGTVYRATDEVLGEDVALKVVADRAALRDEVKLAQKVTHVNVCRTYDLLDIDGHHLLKMELVEGESLATVIARGRLPSDRAIAIARGIAAGLAAAHAQGIVHRDLKPANVMLASERVVLMDFGLASASTEATLSGTPGYMAPEQLAGDDVDRRADLYALGCVLYEMLAGAPVFGGTPIELAARHASMPPPDVRRLRSDVPRWLAGAIAQLLAKQPAKRPAGLARLVAGPRRATVPLAIALVVVAAIAIGFATRTPPDDPNHELEDQVATTERALADERTVNTLQHARRVLDTAPEAAVALVAPLASGPRWVEARAIAAAARAHGLASSMPAPASGLRESGRSVMLDRAGTHLLAVANGGEVEEYDLRARTHRTLVVLDDPEGSAMYAPDGRVVTMTKTGLALVEGGRLRAIAPAHGRLLAVAGTLVYWHERKDEAVWRLDLAGDMSPMRVADVVGAVAAIAPDGHHVAIAGAHAVAIVDATGAPVRVPIADANVLAWSADSARLAVATTYHAMIVEDGKIVLDHDYSTEDQPGIVNGVVFVGDELYAATLPGVRKPESDDRLVFEKPTFGPVATRDGFVATADGRMLVYGAGVHLLQEPGQVFMHVARPDAPYIVGVGRDRVYWWAVDDLLPRRLDATFLVGAYALDSQHVVVADAHGLSVCDVDTGRRTVIGSVSASLRYAQRPGGGRAAVLDADGHIIVFDAGGHVDVLADTADEVWWIEPHELLIQRAHDVVTYDLDTKATATVARLRFDVATSQPGWIAAVTATGMLWRLDRATGLVETANPLVDSKDHDSVLTPNGTLLMSGRDQLFAWPPGGATYRVGTTSSPVASLVPYREAALAITTRDDAFVVDAQRVRPATPADAEGPPVWLASSSHPSLPGLVISDVMASLSWEVTDRLAISEIEIAANTSLLITTTSNAVFVWHIGVPTSPAAMQPWIANLTNAVGADPHDDTIVWPP